MAQHAKRPLADELRIRVNPEFDHEVEPDQNEFAYWNPVSATNDLIKLANAALEITQAITDAMRDRTQLKVELRQVNRELEELDNLVLVNDPLTPTEAKTLKTVSAALERRFQVQGYEDAAKALRAKRDALLDRIEKLDDRIDAGHAWNKTNERVSDNLKTALSFFKDERKRAYQY
jgi:uncharacterized coiled-coil DUF342 family protein